MTWKYEVWGGQRIHLSHRRRQTCGGTHHFHFNVFSIMFKRKRCEGGEQQVMDDEGLRTCVSDGDVSSEGCTRGHSSPAAMRRDGSLSGELSTPKRAAWKMIGASLIRHHLTLDVFPSRASSGGEPIGSVPQWHLFERYSSSAHMHLKTELVRNESTWNSADFLSTTTFTQQSPSQRVDLKHTKTRRKEKQWRPNAKHPTLPVVNESSHSYLRQLGYHTHTHWNWEQRAGHISSTG